MDLYVKRMKSTDAINFSVWSPYCCDAHRVHCTMCQWPRGTNNGHFFYRRGKRLKNSFFFLIMPYILIPFQFNSNLFMQIYFCSAWPLVYSDSPFPLHLTVLLLLTKGKIMPFVWASLRLPTAYIAIFPPTKKECDFISVAKEINLISRRKYTFHLWLTIN